MKILLAAPTSIHKNYCFLEWLVNARSFGCDIFIADNSPGDANKKLYKKLGVKYSWVNPDKKASVNYITESQNQIRDYFLKNDYTHLFFLETDLFPHSSVLQILSSLNLPIVSAPYFIHKGSHAMQMSQDIRLVYRQCLTRNPSLKEQFMSIDGSVKQCYSTGFGCTLIKRSVVERFPFRYTGANLTDNQKGGPSHSDSFFYSDLYLKGVPAYLYTGVAVKHYNSDWGKIKVNERISGNRV